MHSDPDLTIDTTASEKINSSKWSFLNFNFGNIAKGSFCLLGYLILWEVGGLVVQELLSDYKKLYFVTWLHWTPNVLFLLIYLPFIQYQKTNQNKELYQITKQDWKHGILLISVDILCAGAYLYSLDHTNLNINSTLCLTNSIWSYIFAIFLLKEEINIWKNLSVILVLAGILIIIFRGLETENENGKQNSTALGYVILLAGETLYGLSGVLYSKLRHEVANKKSTEDTFIFIGIMGTLNTLLFWIPLLPLHYSGYEIFEFPSSHDWKLISIFALCETSAIILWYLGISIMDPVFMYLGSVLILPIGNVVEYVKEKTTFSLWYYFGMSLILIAFCSYIYGEFLTLKNEKLKNEIKSLQSVKTLDISFDEKDFNEAVDQEDL